MIVNAMLGDPVSWAHAESVIGFFKMAMLEEIEVGLEKPPTVFKKKQGRTVPMGTYLARIREVQEYRKQLDGKRSSS